MSTNINGDTGVSKIQDNTIVTADLQDDAVTLAKMASGTDGNIISYDTSGNPVAVATGSSGQVLTSAGAGAVPTFATISSGGVTHLGTMTTTSGTSQSITGLDFTDLNLLIFVVAQCSHTDGTDRKLQIGVAGGPSLAIGAGALAAGDSIIGQYTIDLRSNIGSFTETHATAITSGYTYGGGGNGISRYNIGGNLRSSSSTSVSASFEAGATFDNGKIEVYGVK
jgi:hypothetical protein